MSSNPLERRATRSPLELHDDGGAGSLHGYAILFGVPSQDLGGHKEVIAAGAVDLAASGDVRFLVGHNDSMILGRVKNRTLALGIDERGVSFSLTLPDTQLARDTRTLVKAGTIDAMSFGFRVLHDTWTKDRRSRTVERLRLFEVSAVAFPAYEASIVEARTVLDARARTLEALEDYRRDFANRQPHRLALSHADRRFALARAGR